MNKQIAWCLILVTVFEIVIETFFEIPPNPFKSDFNPTMHLLRNIPGRDVERRTDPPAGALSSLTQLVSIR